MAKVAAPKTRVTAKHVAEHRAKAGRDNSPKWDGHEQMKTDEFMRHFRNSMEYYRLEHSGKDLKPKVINWMGQHGYSKDDIAEFKKTKDNRCSVTMGAIAANLLKGMPDVRADFNDARSTVAWLKGAIQKTVEEGKNDKDEDEETAEAKPAVPQVSIQERVREASYAMTEEIEDALEAFAANPAEFDPKAFKLVNLLRGKQAKAAHARIIKDFYSRQHAELVEVAQGKCEQLKEAYAHYSKKDLKKSSN